MRGPGATCPECGEKLSEHAPSCPRFELETTELRGPAPQIPGFRILRLVGEGGMGGVYLAEDSTLGRRVAIKLVSEKTSTDRAARERFLREARAMASVQHPNVVRIYSFGEEQGGPYIVMELIEGESLGDRLRRVGKFPVGEALSIALQVADALEAAWAKGVVHRDVKPSNILLDRVGRAHVADFGLAKPVATEDPALTGTGTIVGTPHYVSPEQARGDRVDFRSDMYSLGIVLYEILAGERPFKGNTPASIIAQHLHQPLPSLQQARVDIPSALVELVEKMAERDPARRPRRPTRSSGSSWKAWQGSRRVRRRN